MSEENKTPAEGSPASEGAKVQPKKETVRINLPPKPTAAPTVKIPAPSAAAAPKASAAPAAPAAAAATQKLPTAAPAAAPKAASAPAGATKTAPRPAPAMRPRASATATVSSLDKGLAVVAIIVSLLVVARLALL